MINKTFYIDTASISVLTATGSLCGTVLSSSYASTSSVSVTTLQYPDITDIGGHIGINQPNPNTMYALDVNGWIGSSTNALILQGGTGTAYINNTGDIQIQSIDAGNVLLFPNGIGYGNVGIYTMSPTYSLDVNGIINTNIGYYLNGSPYTASLANSSSYSLTASYYKTFPNIKSGKISASVFGGTPLTYSVTFNTAYENNGYSVSVIGGDIRSWTVEQVNSSNFIISTNSSQPLTDYVYWTSMMVGESS